MKKYVSFLLSIMFVLCTFIALPTVASAAASDGITFGDAEEDAPASPVVLSAAKLKAKSAGCTSIKLTWKKVSGATSYVIYRSTSEGGTYKKIASTKKLTYTDTKRAPQKMYYYKVKAKASGATTSTSNTAGARPIVPAPKTASAASAGSKKIKLTWSKVSGATMYYIYRSTSADGKFKKITSTKNLTYTDSKVENGKTYYYQIKTIKKWGSKYYISK